MAQIIGKQSDGSMDEEATVTIICPELGEKRTVPLIKAKKFLKL